MAITTIDGLIAAYATAKRYPFYIPSSSTEGAGTYDSRFVRSNRIPLTGAAPGSTARACNSSTVGALNPGMGSAAGGNKFYLAGLNIVSTVIGGVLLYDRLVDVSGLSGTNITADTAVSNTAITRPDANGAGVELWQEIYTAYGATTATLNVKYTDNDGNTSQATTYSHPANAPTDTQAIPVNLATGDTGIRAVTNYHWSVSTGTAGNLGFTLRRRIGGVYPMQVANVPVNYNAVDLGLVEIPNDACLEMIAICSGTSTGDFRGEFVIVEG